MAYKWKPSKAARKAFAQRMQNPDERAEYEARKAAKADKRRAGSKFDYNKAGGMYVPTKVQHDYAFELLLNRELTAQEKEACNMVISAYGMNEKVHHDYIHVVNELIRKRPS